MRSVAVYNPNKVKRIFSLWKEVLPNVKPYYAIKSFSDKRILRTLSSFENIGFDVASKGEINKVKGYGKDMILSHPYKQKEDILYAKKNKVSYIVADCEEEIKKIKNIYPESKIVWRIKSYEDNSEIKFNSKFGASIEDTVKVLKEVDVFGMSYHVGSKCRDMSSHLKTIDSILSLKSGIQMIDIGGGFSKEEDVYKLKPILTSLSDKFKVIAEPGRLFSQECITLYTKVIGVKVEGNVQNIYINDSVYNSFSGKVYDHQEFDIPLELRGGYKSVIWGNTCDGEDVIVRDVYMKKMSYGDVIRWDNMGAYSLCSSVDGFNGFKRAVVKV